MPARDLGGRAGSTEPMRRASAQLALLPFFSSAAVRAASPSSAPALGSAVPAGDGRPTSVRRCSTRAAFRSFPPTLAVEGNIGCGKSTLLDALDAGGETQAPSDLADPGRPRVLVVHEPVDRWTAVPLPGGGPPGNLLDLFYSNPTRWAYTFQHYVLMTRLAAERGSRDWTGEEGLRNAIAAEVADAGDVSARKAPTAVRVLERTPFSDRAIFVEASRRQGGMLPLEVAVYDAWYEGQLSSDPRVAPDGFVYLRAAPSTCHDRLRKRGRREESGVPLEYLQVLHEAHEDWLVRRCDWAESSPYHEAAEKATHGSEIGPEEAAQDALLRSMLPARLSDHVGVLRFGRRARDASAEPRARAASSAALAEGSPLDPYSSQPTSVCGTADGWPEVIGRLLEGTPVLILDNEPHGALVEQERAKAMVDDVVEFADAMRRWKEQLRREP